MPETDTSPLAVKYLESTKEMVQEDIPRNRHCESYAFNLAYEVYVAPRPDIASLQCGLTKPS